MNCNKTSLQTCGLVFFYPVQQGMTFPPEIRKHLHLHDKYRKNHHTKTIVKMKIRSATGFWIILLSLILAEVTGNAQGHRTFNADDLQLEWKLITNNYEKESKLLSTFMLRNSGRKTFPGKGWSIYFNYNRDIYQDETTGGVLLQHVNGDIFRMSPETPFRDIPPRQSATISFVSAGELVTYTSAPCGFYLVWDDEPGTGIPLKHYTPLPIVDSTAGFVTPEQIFDENAGIRDLAADQYGTILPTPVELIRLPGEFLMDSTVSIQADPAFSHEAAYLQKVLNAALLGIISEDASGKGKKIKFVEKSMPAEAYQLDISPQEIKILASTTSGIFYGIQSLRALLPLNAWKGEQPSFMIQSVRISDEPRFGYRGLLLDVARNFQKKEQLLRIIDLMGFYKLNTLHLHFSDDEGWRIEIPGLPELTEVGANRGYPLDSKNFLPSSYGAGPVPGTYPASGFYSRGDFIEILRYANERHIKVVPEIETPGHGRAAIKSMDARYEKYMNLGNKAEAEKYLLRDLNDKSEYRSAQLWTDNVMCVALPSVYTFLGKVIDELILMYREAGAPLETINLGGDEVPEGVWEKSPLCQSFLQSGEMSREFSKPSTDDLWYYYFIKTNDLLKQRNLRLEGWEEIGMRKTMLDGEKHYIPNPDFANEKFILHVWNNGIGWGMEDLPYRLANAGYKVILACVSNQYFDLAYEKSPEEPGYYWGGFQDLDKPFYFIPFNYYKNTREDVAGNPVSSTLFVGKDKLTDYGKSNILGIQGLLWAENVRSPEMQEYLLLPKMLGMAERAWASDPEWAKEKDNAKSGELYAQAWSEFVNQVGKRELPRLDVFNGGYHYRIPAVGLKSRNGKVEANCQIPGLILRYTLDGSLPGPQSAVYSGPMDGKGKIRFAAFTSSGRSGRVTEINVK